MAYKKMKLASIILAIVVVFSGCSSISNIVDGEFDSGYDVLPGGENSSQSQYTANPLTGLVNLDKSAADRRPMAIMINNLAAAQKVQTGLGTADIVYETYVEGGVTRLMAVYKDISKAGKIGSVRSARYSYVELAAGHDAIYHHAGMDPVYCKPYMSQLKTDNFNLDGGKSGAYGFREKNGLATEHTLFTSGEKLIAGHSELNWRSTLNGEKKPFMNFVESSYMPTEGVCNTLSAAFSGSYITGFTYDDTSKNYLKTQNSSPHKDAATGEQLKFKNVLVLYAGVTTFPDNKHVKTELTSGTGYYISEGGYSSINWTKGEASDSFVFKTADGVELKANPGNSFVCLINKNKPVDIA